jgi:glutathione S-transferase
MKLYGPAMSQNVFRPLLAAFHCGVPVELAEVAMREGEHKSSAFRSINPFGRIPALQDGEVRLFESVAIAQYIASKADTPAWPKHDDAERARITAWQVWSAAHLAKAIGMVQFERLMKGMFGGGAPDEARIADGLKMFETETGVLDEVLSDGRQWLVGGDHPTLADLDVGGWFLHAAPAGLTLKPHLAAWFERVKALPAWGQAMAHVQMPGMARAA